MKKYFVCIVAVASAFLCSCKKDSLGTLYGPADPNIRIKSIWGSSWSTNLTYDGTGRITLASNSDASRVEYEYPNSLVKQKNFNTAGVLTETYTYELGPDGLAVKQTRMTDPGFSAFYSYNNEKQPLKMVTNISGTVQIEDFFYSNGNCDSARFTNDGNWTLTIKWTYYTDKAEQVGFRAYGRGFRGKDNINLLKTEEYVHPDGSSNGVTNYTYEFDALQRVSKQTGVRGANVYITNYSY